MSSTNKEIRECLKHWWLRYPPFVGRMRTCLKCGAIRAGDNTATIAGNYLEVTVAAAPANPGVGLARVYAISSTSTRMRDSAGTETDLAAGGGGVTKFTSSQQIITSGGLLTLAHGLGAVPFGIQASLECTTNESPWVVGESQTILIGGPALAANRGAHSQNPDATNVYIRYSSDAQVFDAFNKTTGAGMGLTNTSWRLVIRAWV